MQQTIRYLRGLPYFVDKTKDDYSSILSFIHKLNYADYLILLVFMRVFYEEDDNNRRKLTGTG